MAVGKWTRYARRCADQMGLKDWTITAVHSSGIPPDAAALVSCIKGRKIAHIRLSDDYLQSDPNTQRHIMAHELTHCHFAHSDTVASKAMNEADYEHFSDMQEYAVDALAEIVALSLPLPA